MSDRWRTAVVERINSLEGVPFYLIGIDVTSSIGRLQLEQDETDKALLLALNRLCELDADDMMTLGRLFKNPNASLDKPVYGPFSLSDCDVLLEIMSRVRYSELLARLCHLAWLRKPCYPSSLRAILLYLQSASRLLELRESLSVCDDVSLAAHIAVSLGRDHAARKRVAISIRGFLGQAADPAEVIHLLRALASLESDAETSFAYRRATREAGRCARDGDEFMSHDLFLVAADSASQLGNADQAVLCRRRGAESHARLASKSDSSSAGLLFAASWLRQSIQELRSLPGTEDRCEQLGSELARLEQESVISMPSHSVDVVLKGDDAAAMEELFRSVKGKSLVESILVMVRCSNWLQIEHTAPVDRHPSILDLIKHTVVDSYGKPVAEYVPAKGDPTLPSLDDACLHWALVVSLVETLRVQIVSEHPVDANSLKFMTESNPLIPPGHEDTMLRALTAGFNADWILVGHFLILQTEMIVRHLLQAGEMHTRIFAANGRESEITLDNLVASPKAKEMLDPGLLLDLQYMLCTRPLGLGLRNLEAHGLPRDEDYSQPAIEYLWWLILRWFVLFSGRTLTATPSRNPV